MTEAQLDLYLPHFARKSDTSRKAAISIYKEAPSLRKKVLREITDRGGMTCDEIEDILEMRHQTASARVTELRNDGLIIDSGNRRKTRSGRMATVWMEKING